MFRMVVWVTPVSSRRSVGGQPSRVVNKTPPEEPKYMLG